MMNILDRYILHKGIPPLFYCLAAFSLLICVVDLFENLDAILKNDIPLGIILQYYVYMIPTFLTEIMPISVLMASIFTFIQMGRFNELTAIKASGTHIFRVVLPFLFLGLIASLLMIIINEVVVPHTSFHWDLIKERYFKQTVDLNHSYIKKNVALKARQNAYLIKEYNVDKKEMNEITILQYDDQDEIVTRIDAQKAKWTGVGWIFYNGVIRNFKNTSNNQSVMLDFSEKFIQIPEKPETFEKNMDTTMMNYRELKKYIHTKQSSGYKTIKEEVSLYTRLALPFSSFVILLIGIPFILITHKTSIITGIICSIVISFLYKVTSIVGVALGNGGSIPPIAAAWTANLIFAGVGILFMTRIRR